MMNSLLLGGYPTKLYILLIQGFWAVRGHEVLPFYPFGFPSITQRETGAALLKLDGGSF